MNIISLAEIKDNARIEESNENDYLSSVGEVAEAMVLNILERSYDQLIVEYGTVPVPIKHACLMVATHMYEHRSATTNTNLSSIPYGVDALLKPYLHPSEYV